MEQTIKCEFTQSEMQLLAELLGETTDGRYYSLYVKCLALVNSKRRAELQDQIASLTRQLNDAQVKLRAIS